MKPILLGDKPMNFLTKCATKIAGPENRLILGVSALASQPFIDYYNKNVDEKTRKYSVCKTIAKIVVGTTVGVIVRSLAIKYSANLLKSVDISKTLPNALKNPESRKILQYTIGDILGIAVCLFSNFIIDAPLTKLGTNFLAKKYIKEEK
ncbi:MAG: hypothetical protein MJ180_01050 [Candidatus Gastranaerophilales bacterium]|nr:hypothetical protein [Candidatus Gastranaerophilales bacterium]